MPPYQAELGGTPSPTPAAQLKKPDFEATNFQTPSA